MRLYTSLGFVFGAFAFLQNAVASPLEAASGEPVVLAIAQFPESNAFGHIVNGERNTIYLSIESKESERNVTLKNIAGSLHLVQNNKLVKNLTKMDYSIPLLDGAPLQLPYAFHSEFKPGEYRLNIWAEHVSEGQTYRVTAYDSVVTVVEPEGSVFDLKLLLTYVIVTGILGGLGYYTYLTLAPQPKKRKTVPSVSAPVGTVTATGAGGYQEEWIPEHHLKKSKKAKASGAATSGDETSGVESGTEGRRRKGKK
ncbi:hypothetical protein L226DRAFT_570871 [Lentinus tigrinus ALCF2SS1-7]|uniref:Signal sequence receptor subunit alpha n=1 Tax=Lentinus tigrinus ALCF2SS1-6 TaxID=1328759 RepID=A0A5C2SCY2_9APHY|nr:hypothetical protein L227DRAFT_610716 [Lentinus tigrinus ALCF2SS1-6]RPD75217.1 hypothetical protein L226DRAFT_570871 [Lentinus tigrinus ALCF2SS1-7]